ncbi:MAG: ATP synthase subunit I [Betaproteobacteria bacterium]|nr:ATP synthase subunit I [Betaproteobacteria bacterium]
MPTETVQALNTWQDEHEEAPREPLSREQAQALLRAKPGVSAWRVVGLQLGVTVACAVLGWLLAGPVAAWSAAWGGGMVLVPAALFATAMRRWLVRLPPAYALFGFAFGELLKIALTVLLLVLAPRVLPALSWPALLLGLVATLQVYWIALLLRGKSRGNGKQA